MCARSRVWTWLAAYEENRPVTAVIVTFKREGGVAFFPRLSQPVVIDTERLPQQQRDELEDFLRRCDFFALPPSVGQRRSGAADMREYSITVQHGNRGHSVRFIEPFENPDVEALIAKLEAYARGIRHE